MSTGHDTTLPVDGTVNEALVAYQEARARGGAGLIVLQVSGVHETARYTNHVLMATDDSAIPGYRRVAEAVRLRGILHSELGHLEQAAADLKRVTELKPGDEIAYFKLAEIYRRLAQGELDQRYQKLAQESLERYLEIRNKQIEIKTKRPAD